LSYAQQALSQQLQQESGTEMDTLVSGVKFIKAYGKEKDILISTVRVMRHLFYMLKINMTLQDIIKALNDKYKTAAKTEEKVEKAEVKTEEKEISFYNNQNLHS
jgi:outer membrane protein